MTVLEGAAREKSSPVRDDRFGFQRRQVQWVITGYLLSIAASIPLSGWLGDRLGTTRVYLASLAAFGGSSALCAAAHSLPELVGARVLQGLGAGFMMPVAMAMLYRAYPPARRVHIARMITRVTVLAPGLLLALTIRDADAASTMGAHPEREAEAGLAVAE